ncbi:MAG: GWxTD domain-containing protein [bacterium]
MVARSKFTLFICSVLFFLTLTLVPFNLFAVKPGAPHQGRKNLQAEAFFQKGATLARKGKVLPAIDAFRAAVEIDPRYAEGYHQMALEYMKLGTIDGRTKATRAMKKALRLDDQNAHYWLSMARLSLKKQMRGEAKACFNKVLKLDPHNAEAYYHLGLLKEKDMLWYKDLISPQTEGVTFNYTPYAEDDLKNAQDYYKQAIVHAPKFSLAYFHLALICYELQDYSAMRNYLSKALDFAPDNKDFHLFLGLAFHRLGQYESAVEFYNAAKKYMSDEELALFDSIEPLLNPKMREKYVLLNEEEKSRFENRFWKQRDPLFLTEFNERRLEHYGRFAHANLRFGFPEKGIEGWQTDRGKTYIRFGPPTVHYKTRPELVLNFRSNPLHPSKEYWGYHDFDFTFIDEYLSRNYKFKRDLDPENDSKIQFEQLIKKVPEYYQHNFGRPLFDVPYLITQFRGDSGKSRVELYYGMPSEPLGSVIAGDAATYHLKRGVFVFTEQWDDVLRRVQARAFSVDATVAKIASEMIDRSILELRPGNYNIALELVDQQSGTAGILRTPLQVRAFSSERIDMSDILLTREIRDRGSVPVFDSESLHVVPALDHRFALEEPIKMGFELYHLTLDDAGTSNYRIETVLRPLEKKKSGLAAFTTSIGKVFGKGGTKTMEVSTSHDFQGSSNLERQSLSVQLAQAVPGKYAIIVRVTDLNRGTTVSKEADFEIVESFSQVSKK